MAIRSRNLLRPTKSMHGRSDLVLTESLDTLTCTCSCAHVMFLMPSLQVRTHVIPVQRGTAHTSTVPCSVVAA